jgi:hypothetical protein
MKHRVTAAILAAMSATVGIAAAVAPAHPPSPAPPKQSTVRVAEQLEARPGSAVSGGCYVQGRRYPNGAKVPLDPGPGWATAAPIYVRCAQGMLCYYSAPSVCIRPGHGGR